MTTSRFGSIDSQRIRAVMVERPLAVASGSAMVVGLVVAMLFSAGYAVGKDTAMADNRADQARHDR